MYNTNTMKQFCLKNGRIPEREHVKVVIGEVPLQCKAFPCSRWLLHVLTCSSCYYPRLKSDCLQPKEGTTANVTSKNSYQPRKQ